MKSLFISSRRRLKNSYICYAKLFYDFKSAEEFISEIMSRKEFKHGYFYIRKCFYDKHHMPVKLTKPDRYDFINAL